MARFDVYRTNLGELVLDCQADVFWQMNTRFVVPLQPPDAAPITGRRLNPRFEIDGGEWCMVTQFAAAIPTSDLRQVITSLRDHDAEITAAIDMLTCGI